MTQITLSRSLFERLSAEATRLGVPLEWVGAGLVADTIEARSRQFLRMIAPARSDRRRRPIRVRAGRASTA